MKSRNIIVCLFVLCMVATFVMVLISTPSRTALTSTYMTATARELLIYKEKYGIFPDSLLTLKKESERRVRVKDGWGEEFIYSMEGSGACILKSLGADRETGGSDKAADIVKTVCSVRKSGVDIVK